ncbi:hypothetical protein QCI42_20865 [Bacillus fungorum]|uniref:hypothetical protein n=1 Tax=Bacillus fungorum TaxID=2039284 RepID=UPI003399BFEF
MSGGRLLEVITVPVHVTLVALHVSGTRETGGKGSAAELRIFKFASSAVYEN